jgi:hypothetical protein
MHIRCTPIVRNIPYAHFPEQYSSDNYSNTHEAVCLRGVIYGIIRISHKTGYVNSTLAHSITSHFMLMRLYVVNTYRKGTHFYGKRDY